MNFFHAVASAGRIPTPTGIVTTNLIWWIDPTNSASYPGSGTSIFDLVGSTNGTFAGNVFVNAQKHMVLDGVNDWVSMGTISSANPLSLGATSFTINVWWRYAGTGDNFPHTFSMWQSTASSADGLATFISRSARGVGFLIRTGGVTRQFGTAVSGILTTLNTWEYWSFVYDKSTSTGTIYKNGVPAISGTLHDANVSNKLLRIGASNYDTFSDFNGRLGAHHVYNRALTTAEILQNYNATLNGY